MKNSHQLITSVMVGATLMGSGLVTGLIAVSASQPMIAQAKEPLVPKSVNHYPTRKITYHIDSTSKYYRQVWQQAIKNWNKQKIVKLVPVKSKKRVQIRVWTVKKLPKGLRKYAYNWNYDIEYSKKYKKDLMSTSTAQLSQETMHRSYMSKLERINVATGAIGSTLGLLKSRSEWSVMGTSMQYNSISKYDRQGLQRAYQGVK